MIEAISNILTAFGLSTSAGLNAYVPLLTVALLARFTDLIAQHQALSVYGALHTPAR